MQPVRLFFLLIIAISMFASSGTAADKQFDSKKMMADLEQQLKLSSEKMSRLKPAIDAKSAELKKSIHEAVDQGFVQMDELGRKLDEVSKDAEKKAKDVLNSEEMAELREYMSKIDREAIQDAKDKLVAKLTAILALTREQAANIKPVLEDSLARLSTMLNQLAKEGSKSLEDFKHQYERLGKETKNELQDMLDDEQIKRYEKYIEENKKKIEKVMFNA
ncbi:MAG: hypothetical protein JRF04_06225 [Deltaproteobacteria bacterium]|nr:hypothetical protein [Deltaproteobacteria bacterium]